MYLLFFADFKVICFYKAVVETFEQLQNPVYSKKAEANAPASNEF